VKFYALKKCSEEKIKTQEKGIGREILPAI
jgi:hypothetical protein